jgi:integrase
VLAAGIRFGVLARPNPAVLAGPNPAPAPRPIRVYTLAELDALELELGPAFGPVVPFAAATGLRPSEWAALERRHVDGERRILTVDGTKTRGSRREGSARGPRARGSCSCSGPTRLTARVPGRAWRPGQPR